MTEAVAYRFIEALDVLERSGDVEPIAATFSDACELENSLSLERHVGKEGAANYWHQYRARFRNLHSSFKHIIAGENSIALEWTTSAVADGKQVRFEGVTILDTAAGQITRLRAYVETRKAAGRILPQSEGGHAESLVSTAAVG